MLLNFDQNELVEPSIAIAPWKGNAYTASVIYDRVVIFPPPTGTKIPMFARAPGDKKQIDLVKVDLQVLSEPYIVSYEDRVIVLPDMIRKEVPIPERMLRLPADTNQEPQWLLLEEEA